MLKIFKQSGGENDGPALQKLVSALENTSSEPYLSEAQKSSMRHSLLALIEARNESLPADLGVLADKVGEIANENYLGSYQKKLIFKSVIGRAGRRLSREISSLWVFRNWRSGLASVLTFALLLGIFVTAPFDLRMTRASKWTFLEKVSGEVFINRNGRIFGAGPNFGLQQGDLIFTGAGSSVAIRYLDDSVTRLGENTSLEISRLYVRPENAVKTQVELSLLGGQVWASVYNLIDGESRFVIETDNARADVNSRASFAITSMDDITVLSVFDNVVDLSKKTGKAPYVQSIVAGFQAEVSSNPFKVASAGSDIFVQKILNDNNQWVIANMALDQEHQNALKAENKQFIADAVVSAQTLGMLADFRDNTKSLFANADVEKARQRFLDVHLGFITAQEYLGKADRNNNFRQQATPLLIQYKVAIQEINDAYEGLKAQDAGQADILLAQMKEEVDLQRKALSLALPSEALYTAKLVVMEAGGYFARTSSEKAVYLLDRSRNRLLEIQNLIAKNNLQDAEAIFRTYLNGLNTLVSEVEKAQVSDIEANLFALLDEQIKQFKLLTVIESKLLAKNDQRLTGLVTAVKNDSLSKLIEIVKVYRKNGFPLNTLMGLKNTIEEFFPDSIQKDESLADLQQLLMEYPEYVQMKEAENVQLINSQIRDAVIVDFEASKDLNICVSDCA